MTCPDTLKSALELGATVSTIIQAVFVVVSLYLVVKQLRQNTDLAKAANAQALVEHAATLNTLLMQDPELAALWYSRGKVLPDNPSKMHRERYREMLVQWLIFHENIFHQNRAGLLDPVVYQSWARDLEFTAKYHDLSVVADDLGRFFPGKFGEHLVALAKPAGGEPAPPIGG